LEATQSIQNHKFSFPNPVLNQYQSYIGELDLKRQQTSQNQTVQRLLNHTPSVAHIGFQPSFDGQNRVKGFTMAGKNTMFNLDSQEESPDSQKRNSVVIH